MDGWLRFHDIPSNWNDARLRCELEGGELTWPRNDTQQNILIAMVKKYRPEQKTFYIGISDVLSRGDFLAIDGEIF